jgi:hypothetical protein
MSEIEIGTYFHYHDRCGNPISIGRWIDLSEDFSYVVVQRTPVGGVWEVSTVWLGINYQWFGEPPLIFETMIFEIAESYDLGFTYHESMLDFQARYSTEMQAHDGHWATVEVARTLFLPAVIKGGQNAV